MRRSPDVRHPSLPGARRARPQPARAAAAALRRRRLLRPAVPARDSRPTTSPRCPPGSPTATTLLEDARTVELISTATMLGDVVADAYAALMAEQSFKGLIDMLELACREGIDAVPDAPPELERVHRGDGAHAGLARHGPGRARARATSAIPPALLAPFVIRGAFIATFLNTYAALPMALTGALGGRKRRAPRQRDGELLRRARRCPARSSATGAGFEAAAMVRLMHSMVRFNALKRSDRWDLDVYGIPIPQVDQMPAGLINVYLLAAPGSQRGPLRVHAARARGRRVQPLPLLPARAARGAAARHAEEIVRVMHARAATAARRLRRRDCGALVRATMDAYLQADALRCPTALPTPSRRATARPSSSAPSSTATARPRPRWASHSALATLRVAVTAPFVTDGLAGPDGRRPRPGPARHRRRASRSASRSAAWRPTASPSSPRTEIRPRPRERGGVGLVASAGCASPLEPATSWVRSMKTILSVGA